MIGSATRRAGHRTAAMVSAAVLACLLATPARAQDEDAGMLTSMTFLASAGLAIPAGEEGVELDVGGHLGLDAFYETSYGFAMGIESTWSRSLDPYAISMTSIAATARLGPASDIRAAYLQFSAGGYLVNYGSAPAGATPPESTLRPGGSFGIGFELLQFGKFGFGGFAAYHGIVLNRSDLLAFVSAAVTLSWQPGQL